MASSLIKLFSCATRKYLSSAPVCVTDFLTAPHTGTSALTISPSSRQLRLKNLCRAPCDELHALSTFVVASLHHQSSSPSPSRHKPNQREYQQHQIQHQLQQSPLFQRRFFSTSAPFFRARFIRKSALQQSERTKDFGTHGELTMTQAQELPALELKLSELADNQSPKTEVEADAEGVALPSRRTALDWMPRPEDYETVYENGKKFKELPILFLSAQKNNTKLMMTDARQMSKAYTSAGEEGFKGAKRGTNIAAQTTAMSFAKKLVRQSKVTHVRVVVKGIGPGRLSAIEGLTMGGLNVVSITDDTKTFGLDQGQGPGPRPRCRRRV